MLKLTIILAVAVCILLFLCFVHMKELRSIIVQMRDVSHKDTNVLLHSQRGAEKKLINEINSLLKETRTIRAEYKQKSHTLEQMMTNISHDLRTPLTSAMGYIDLIRNSNISEEEKKRELEIIQKRLIRLEELINSFFELSQIVLSEKKPQLSEIDLIGVLEESIVHYYDDYSCRGRKVIFNCDKHRLKIASNRNMLMRIFDNLIGNALKHSEGDLSISVIDSDSIRIVFENTLGSEEISIDHVFDEFYTTDISRTKGNTGLGLAIAKQFTELLGGSIDASIEGDKFIMSLVFPE